VIHRLWFRLSLTFAVIILVTVVTIYFFVSQRIADEMEYYTTISAQYRSDQILSRLYLFYWKGRSWESVQTVVEDTARVSGTRIILVAANGTVVGDSKTELLGTNYTDSSESPVEMFLGTQFVGDVYIIAPFFWEARWQSPSL
jgi:succinate dehydrogenase hydrophobic anchor subunit